MEDFFMNTSFSKRTKMVTTLAMFSALAFITTFICSFVPKVAGFLSLEIKDAVITLCSLLFGPVSGLVIAVIVPIIESFTISVTGWYGLIMNVLSSATFCLVTGLIYKYRRSFYGAVIALFAGVFSVTAVMMLANLFITPLYLTKVMGFPWSMSDVAEMIPTVLLPFNFLKSTLNASIVLLIYKPISKALKRAKILEGSSLSVTNIQVDYKKTAVISAIALLIIVLSLVLIFTVVG